LAVFKGSFSRNFTFVSLKVVSSDNYGGSKIAPIVGFWPGTVALGIILNLFIRRCLVLNIFPFPISTAKFIGELYYNRQSAANRCPRFAYSFVALMLRQYYWRYDSYFANRRRTANMENPRKSLYWHCESVPLRLKARRVHTPSPISAGRIAAPILFTM
jgi:hypothetical protein